MHRPSCTHLGGPSSQRCRRSSRGRTGRNVGVVLRVGLAVVVDEREVAGGKEGETAEGAGVSRQLEGGGACARRVHCEWYSCSSSSSAVHAILADKLSTDKRITAHLDAEALLNSNAQAEERAAVFILLCLCGGSVHNTRRRGIAT